MPEFGHPGALFEGRPVGGGWARAVGWRSAAIWGAGLWTAVGGVGNRCFSRPAVSFSPPAIGATVYAVKGKPVAVRMVIEVMFKEI